VTPPATSVRSAAGTIRADEDGRALARACEAAALEVPGVHDAWLSERTDVRGVRWRVLYLVADDDVRADGVQRAIGCFQDGAAIRLARVTSLPLDGEGRVDELRLLQLPVVDAALIDELRRRGSAGGQVLDWSLELDTRALVEPTPGGHAAETRAPGDTRARPSRCDADRATLPLSLAQGGEVDLSAGRSLADLLIAAAHRRPDRGCIFVEAEGTRTLSYGELLEASLRVVSALRERGAARGEHVIVSCEDRARFLPAFWGCILAGLIPVPVAVPLRWSEDDAGLAKLRNACGLLGAPWILVESASLSALASGGWLADGEARATLSIEACLACPPSEHWVAADPDTPALLLLTSGSSGLPKAVQQSHRALVHQVSAAAQRLALGPADISLNWFALDHVGGLVMFHLRDLAAGIDQLQVPTRRILGDPLIWLDLIEQWRVTVSWAPNFAYGLVARALLQRPQRSWNLRSVRVLMNGGESIVRSVAKDFLRRLAPHGLAQDSMVAAWGMSETCSAVTYDEFDASGEIDSTAKVCVGRPIPGVDLRIVDEEDALVPEGSVGRLQIRGVTVTSGYRGNPAANAEAFTTDGWFVTGDLGLLRAGRLSIVGRHKDVVIVNGLNLPCNELDAVVERVPGVSASYGIVVPVQSGASEEVAVFIHGEGSREDWPRVIGAVRMALLRAFGLHPRYVLPVEKSEFLRTAIGKIQRSAMATRLSERRFQALIDELGQSHAPTGSVPDWFFTRAWRQRSAVPATRPHPEVTLLFADQPGLARELSRSLPGRVVTIDAGDGFAQRGAGHFAIDPACQGDYARLVDAVVLGAPTAIRIVHCWGYGPSLAADREGRFLERARIMGFDSLVRIARATAAGAPLVELVAVTSDLHDDQAGAGFGRAAVAALVETLPSEHPCLRFRHVDLASGEHPQNRWTLQEELQGDGRDPEVRYRGGRRCIPALVPVHARPRPVGAVLRQRGCYLVTGGLGGVGFHVASWLLQSREADLLLIGRRAIENDGVADGRWERFETLRSLPGSVRYVAADIADPVLLAAALREAEQAWGRPVEGVFHFAGDFASGPCEPGEDPAGAAVGRAKVAGSWALEMQFADRPEVFFINTSSALTVIRGSGTAAYTAANCFVEAFTRFQRARRRAWCLAWSGWRGVGMARDVAATSLMERKGLRMLPVEDALASLELVLQQDEAVVFVGLDAARSPVKRLLPTVAASCRVAVRSTEGSGGAISPQDDEFGVPLDLVWRKDSHAAGPTGRDSASSFEAPVTAAERALAELWRQILGVPQVGRRDNFFEHGGTSLSAAELLVAAEKRFGRRLGFASLMTRPTLEALAEALSGEDAPGDIRLLVPMQTQGSRPAFFGTHPLFGLVYPYAGLARELGTDQPFYALQARAYLPGQQAHASIEDMARDYVRAIREAQPQGPYYLGGWSFGSLIAMEMAQQLQTAGETVGCLVIIDQATDSLERFFDEVPVRIKLERFFSIVGDAMRAYDPYYARHAGWLSRLARPVKLWRFIRSVFLPMVRIGMINTGIARNYQLKPYQGNVALLHTGDPEFTRITDERLGWDRLVRGRVDVYRIPGNHLTLHEPPNVAVLAAALTDALAAARGAQGTQA
jgi:acyl-CoA synthetase (AMP-forming)/AMP-acid ligase II/thioesterase domain-containing protein/nucleoside-diphosphate-sugar epimerase